MKTDKMVLKGQDVEEKNKLVQLSRTRSDLHFAALRTLMARQIVASEGIPELIVGDNPECTSEIDKINIMKSYRKRMVLLLLKALSKQMERDEWDCKVIEKPWRLSTADRPWRTYRYQRWYEVQWAIYLQRWIKGKIWIMWHYPFSGSLVDWSSGEPLIAKRRNKIDWKAPWMEN